MIALPVEPVFSQRLRDAVEVLEEIKRRGVSEQAAATLMVYLAIDRVGEDLDRVIGDVAAELNQLNFRAEAASS